MRMPKYAVPLSVIGTVAGCTVLLKDYMGGPRYRGNERIAGKTVVITGANTGIGKETAKELARRGGRIILACRDMDKCELVKKEIISETANKSIECRKLDLASLDSVRAFCETINATESHLDILINNAGVMMCPKMLTEDGLEMQLGVNHFGHFLLTNLLLDKLKASAPSRIIIVSSLAHTRGTINFDDLNSAKAYSKRGAYEQSKLANLLHQRELVKRLEGTGVTVNSLHPGVVDTELGRHLPFTKSLFSSIVLWPIKFILMKTPVQGAQTTIRLAVDPTLESVTGKYFSSQLLSGFSLSQKFTFESLYHCTKYLNTPLYPNSAGGEVAIRYSSLSSVEVDCQEKVPAEQALDDNAAKRLWAISEAWTGSNVQQVL